MREVEARLLILLGAVLLNIVQEIVRLDFNRLQGESNYQASKQNMPTPVFQ